jgi:formamidopyrimidine-DNA glycosylase
MEQGMPELPDVETSKRYLDATALHRTIRRTRVPEPRVLRTLTPAQLGRRLKGHSFEAGHRHGKYLFVRLSAGGGWLVLHFGMTGRLEYSAGKRAPPDHTAVLFAFSDGGRLAYASVRKLGLVSVTDDPQAFVRRQGLGPDALTLDADRFRKLAQQRQGSVKCWLMNQQVMAGIGNVYADEILFRAGLHPGTALDGLDGRRLASLFGALQQTLDMAIRAGAEPQQMPDPVLLRHRHDGAHCPRCGGTVRRIAVCGRSGYYCPRCQHHP